VRTFIGVLVVIYGIRKLSQFIYSVYEKEQRRVSSTQSVIDFLSAEAAKKGKSDVSPKR